MKTSTKKVLKVFIPILLAIILGWYSFSKIPLGEMLPYFKSANYYWIGLGVFCGFLSHLSRAYRWNFLLEPLGYKIKLPNSFMAVFGAYLSNYGIPRSGEVLRAAVAANYEDIAFDKAFGTIVAERLADMLVMVGIILITLFIQFEYILNLLKQSINPDKIALVFGLLLLLSVTFFFYIKRSKSALSIKFKQFFMGLKEGVFSIFKMKNKWSFIGHTLFIWGMYVFMFYITTFALKDLEGVTIGMILVAFIAASFTIALTNSGVVAYPLAVLAALSLFGIAETPSFAFGWIMWSSQTLMIIIIGILSFIYLPIYNRKFAKDLE